MADANADAEWEPIIGSIPIAHPTLKVTFDGSSLLINNEYYYDNVAQYLTYGPALTPTGRVAKNQPRPPPKRNATWWKAQCAFRGLSAKGTIAQLQERLRGHEKEPIAEDIVSLKAQAKIEYRTKNNAAVEDEWKHKMTGDEKALADPRRYLTEVFAAGATGGPDVVVMKGEIYDGLSSSQWVNHLAKDLGLECTIVDAPVDKSLPFCSPNRKWAVVGRSKGAVAERAHSIMAENERQKEAERKHDAAMKRQEEESERREKQRLKTALDKCGNWEVTGTYEISCPAIEKDYGSDGPMTLEIFRGQTSKGLQMYASFDFSVLTGVFRFERPQGDTKPPQLEQANSSKRKRAHLEEEEDEYEDEEYDRYGDYDERRRSPTPETFYLGKQTQPSARYPTWSYRWRGNESGENVIEVGSDEKLYEITFFGPRVERIEGTFGGSLVPDCTFTGARTGVGSSPDEVDISAEWADRSEATYEYRRVARWR